MMIPTECDEGALIRHEQYGHGRITKNSFGTWALSPTGLYLVWVYPARQSYPIAWRMDRCILISRPKKRKKR